MMTKVIAVFNHKGGVSKTTTSFNLGWSIARKGKKVILVDADSQCNLTLFTLGRERYEKFYESNNPNNINTALKPAYKSEPKLIDFVECIQVPRNENLWILPGHLDFSENEVQLGISMQLSEAFGAMKNLPGAFNYLIQKTAKKYEADYIIVDMNPSLSAINQNILLSSNFFLVPTSPDLFSMMAIRSLSRIIPTWESWAKKARDLLDDSTYPLPKGTPKFLGYTVNDFNLTKGDIQRDFRSLMGRISSEVENSMAPKFEKHGLLMSPKHYNRCYETMRELSDSKNLEYDNYFCLAQISNFNKLIAKSNEASIPVFELSPERLGESQAKTLRWFNFLFKVFSQRIIDLTQNIANT